MATASNYLAAELFAQIGKVVPRKKRPQIAKLIIDAFSDSADMDWSLEPGSIFSVAYPDKAKALRDQKVKGVKR